MRTVVDHRHVTPSTARWELRKVHKIGKDAEEPSDFPGRNYAPQTRSKNRIEGPVGHSFTIL
ncbi:hypothetical protein [Paenibacillus chitinolyticus]